MFYNTKVVPLFDIASVFMQKNMFYNTFLDIHQLIPKSQHAKRDILAG